MNQNLKPDELTPFVFVDDNEMELQIVSRMYAKVGHPNPVVLLNSGNELIEYLSSCEKKGIALPQVTFLDINMPILNGFETLKHIRLMNNYISSCKIVMLTNSVDPDDKKKSFDLGANGFVSKPKNPKEYIEFLKSIKTY